MPHRMRSYLGALFRRSRLESDMDREMRLHLELYYDDLVRSGISPDEARRRAGAQFGSLERMKEECRESRGLAWSDEFVRNVRYAVRTLRRSPAFTLAAILTLALCIGANTAIFSVIDAVLLRPLPFPEPDRLAQIVTLYHSKSAEGVDDSQDGRTWEMLRDHATFLDTAASGGGWSGANLATGGRARYVDEQRVTAGYFAVLGVRPVIGREFTREEDRPGGPPVAMIGHSLWTNLFAADPSIVGRSILVKGEPHTVVGVMPAGFRMLGPADVWTPLRPTTTGEGSGTNYGVIARLRPGTTWVQAASQVEALGQRLLEGKRIPPETTVRYTAIPMQTGLSNELRTTLLIIQGAVALVLVIGCVNIAGLMLARAGSRTREIATRAALGGGRSVVIRQLLTESLVIAIAGGLASIGLGYAGIRALSLVAEDSLGVWQNIRLDWRVLVATMVVSVMTSIVFGLLPAVRASRVDIRTALSEGGARGVAGSSSRWPRRLLVAGEVALAFVLLVSAALLIRTFIALRDLSPGFDGTGVMTAAISLDDARYNTSANMMRLFTNSLERIRATPGVESAAVALSIPYERWLNMGARRLDGPAPGRIPITTLNYVTPGFFDTLRIPVRSGRPIDDRDTSESRKVAMVNEAFLRRYLKDQDPLSSHIGLGGSDQPIAIIGVTGNVQQRPGWGGGIPLSTPPAVYVPASQMESETLKVVHVWFSPHWIVRGTGGRESLTAAMQRAVEATDPLLPFSKFKTLDAVRDRTLIRQRFQAILLGTLAGLALLLAAVGLYGMIANTVVERTREIGIRMALGATAAQVIRAVVAPGILIAVVGLGTGAVLAAFSIRALRSLIYGVESSDAWSWGAAAICLLVVAAAGSLLPSFRITRANPAATLRYD